MSRSSTPFFSRRHKRGAPSLFRQIRDENMDKLTLTMPQQVAQAAIEFERQRTGRAPDSVTVVLSDDTVVITLHRALSPAERAVALSPEGAAQVREFHQQLFVNASDSLREAIKRITGVEVRETASEVETGTGTMVGVFTTGTTVQVFLMANSVPAGTWTEKRQANVGMLDRS